VARTLIVSILHISARTAAKIADDDHGNLTPQALRAVLVDVGPLPFVWDHDPKRGDRAYIFTAIDDQAYQVVLYPARSGNAEEWHLGSAYPENP
jgi:hypothetical protein